MKDKDIVFKVMFISISILILCIEKSICNIVTLITS